MKNKLEKVMIIILIILIIIIAFFTTKKNIKATNDMEILTKNSLFDIIDNIGEIAITCLSTDGNRFFSEEDKIDFTMLYIIKNRIFLICQCNMYLIFHSLFLPPKNILINYLY